MSNHDDFCESEILYPVSTSDPDFFVVPPCKCEDRADMKLEATILKVLNEHFSQES